MTTVLAALVDRWPGGTPQKLSDGTIVSLTLSTTELAIIPQASGVDEVFPAGVDALAVETGADYHPTDAAKLNDWYGRAPGGQRFNPSNRGRVHVPALVALPLSEVPDGVDVFVCVSGRTPTNPGPGGPPTGEPFGYATVRLGGFYYDESGSRQWALEGVEPYDVATAVAFAESHGLPPPVLSRGAAARNAAIYQGTRCLSQWIPVRVGAAMTGGSTIAAPDGTRIPITARSSLLSFGDTPPIAPTLSLVAIVGGVPWFRSGDPRDAPLGLFPGTALAQVADRVDGAGVLLPGVFAVEKNPGAADSPWYVMRLRSE